MPSTSPLGLRTPPSTGVTPDVPRDMLTLAQDVQQALGSLSAPLQEGVLDSGSFVVTQASGGASMTLDVASDVGAGAYVDDDGLSPARVARYYVSPTASKSTVTVATAHATLPRVDAVVLSMTGVVSIVAGTATSGATIDNARDGSHGGAAIPSDALHLADVHVPATDTTIANAQIRDRRKWARGAFARMAQTSDVTVTSTTFVQIASGLSARVECSGAPIRLAVGGQWSGSGSPPGYGRIRPTMDGAVIEQAASTTGYRQWNWSADTLLNPLLVEYTFTPTAGSHIFDWQACTSSGDSLVFFCDTTSGLGNHQALVATIEEIIRPNARNNTATSG